MHFPDAACTSLTTNIFSTGFQKNHQVTKVIIFEGQDGMYNLLGSNVVRWRQRISEWGLRLDHAALLVKSRVMEPEKIYLGPYSPPIPNVIGPRTL